MTEIIKDRSMIDDKYKWDLTKVYKTNDDFESDCEKVKNLITEYRKKYETKPFPPPCVPAFCRDSSCPRT